MYYWQKFLMAFDGISEKVFLVLIACVDGTFDFSKFYQCALQPISLRHLVPFDFIL
jgi:hypothetical protein